MPVVPGRHDPTPLILDLLRALEEDNRTNGGVSYEEEARWVRWNNARKRERRAGGGAAAVTATARPGGEGELWATLPTADGGARGRGVWMRQLALGAALTAATVLCRCVLRPRGS